MGKMFKSALIEHMFITVDRYFVCKRGSFFIVLFVPQFLSRVCLGVKPDLFSARMTVMLTRSTQ